MERQQAAVAEVQRRQAFLQNAIGVREVAKGLVEEYEKLIEETTDKVSRKPLQIALDEARSRLLHCRRRVIEARQSFLDGVEEKRILTPPHAGEIVPASQLQ